MRFHHHEWSNWHDTKILKTYVFQLLSSDIPEKIYQLQEKRCRKCNKLKSRKVKLS